MTKTGMSTWLDLPLLVKLERIAHLQDAERFWWTGLANSDGLKAARECSVRRNVLVVPASNQISDQGWSRQMAQRRVSSRPVMLGSGRRSLAAMEFRAR